MEVGELPEGWIATGLLVLVKAYDPSAGPDDIPVRISIRGTDDLSTIDALGMLAAAQIDVGEQYKHSMGDG